MLEEIAPEAWDHSRRCLPASIHPSNACSRRNSPSIAALTNYAAQVVSAAEQWSGYSVTESAAAALKAERDRAEVERTPTELAAIHARAREEAMDRLPPATVRAYRQVYGRDPRGWPPA